MNPIVIGRRSWLQWLATGVCSVSAGCSTSDSSGRGATDIVVHNESTDRRTIAIAVEHAEDETQEIDTEIDLAPNTSETFNNRVLMNDDYTVEVDVEEGPAETHTWSDAGRPLHVLVDDTDNIVFAVQVG